MKRLSLMFLAGEASGDTLAAELVGALREELACFQSQPTSDLQPLFTSLEPTFFGAGGPKMAAAGVDLAVDLTAHSVFGLGDVFRKYFQFRALMSRLLRLAVQRQPDVIVCVDFAGFNRRFAQAVRKHVRARTGVFQDWNPKIVQFVSPQVWASRPGRATAMARDFDLLLSIFPFEKAWYAERAPELRVEFVGHPMLDRYEKAEGRRQRSEVRGQESEAREGASSRLPVSPTPSPSHSLAPLLLLLPGSRARELERHLPVMVEAARKILSSRPVGLRMVLPNDALAGTARALTVSLPEIEVRVGRLAEALAQAGLAIASSGTVTMECAFFGVPTVVLYKVAWPEFQLARRLVRVPHIAMPNLLAGEAVFPEFIQDHATPENLARASLELLGDEARRQRVKARLREVITSLGPPGASRRAAREIVKLLSVPLYAATSVGRLNVVHHASSQFRPLGEKRPTKVFPIRISRTQTGALPFQGLS